METTGPTLLLSDDHCILRESVKMLLESRSHLRVVGHTGDGLAVLRLTEQLRPDVVVTELTMPGISGFEVLRQLPQRCAKTVGVVLSMFTDEAHVLEALRCGARAYVLKSAGLRDLEVAIEEALAGRRYLSPPLGDRAFALYSELASLPNGDSLDCLTAREREILQFAATGLTNIRIAERLCISPRTVETHRTHLMHKLSLHNHTDLVRFAIKRGILSLD
jgi:DNA-binding NarL/FixJ family response regulator